MTEIIKEIDRSIISTIKDLERDNQTELAEAFKIFRYHLVFGKLSSYQRIEHDRLVGETNNHQLEEAVTKARAEMREACARFVAGKGFELLAQQIRDNHN